MGSHYYNFKDCPKNLESPKYAKNVAMIQVDKFLRNLSKRVDEGNANRIRQCSIRDYWMFVT